VVDVDIDRYSCRCMFCSKFIFKLKIRPSKFILKLKIRLGASDCSIEGV
jgi:hypothetical protein